MKTIEQLVKEAFTDATSIYKNVKVDDWFPEFKLQNPEVCSDIISDFSNEIDTIGKCANCGVEFHIHKHISAVDKVLLNSGITETEANKMLGQIYRSDKPIDKVSEAIEFAEWVSKNYNYVSDNLWDGDNEETYTTKELYQQFLQSLKQ